MLSPRLGATVLPRALAVFLLVVFAAPVTQAQFLPSRSLESGQVGAAFGFAVANAGDVNGDGFDDLLVGSYAHRDTLDFEGRAYLYLGSSAGIAATPVWTYDGGQENAWFGLAVAGAGDVNGDGHDDILIGARRHDVSGTDEGRAYLFFGATSGPSTTPDWVVDGDQPSGAFGSAVDGAGDVDNDGFDDIVVTAFLYDDGEQDEGRAYLYLGSLSGPSTTPDWTAEGDQISALFGWDIAGAGDVNDDGFDDVVVGIRLYDNGEQDEGRAAVYLGGASGLAATPAWTSEPDLAGARLGTSVAGAGDVNNDGFDDVILGADRFATGEINEGATFVHLGSASGPSAVADWSFEADQAGASLGRAVSPAGDLNGDGFDDVIVAGYLWNGAQNDTGRAWTFLGSASGLENSPFDLLDQKQPASNFGFAVAGGGDFDGDGLDDLVVGADLWDAGNGDEGRTFVYSSKINACLAAGADTSPQAFPRGFAFPFVNVDPYDLAWTGDEFVLQHPDAAGGLNLIRFAEDGTLLSQTTLPPLAAGQSGPAQAVWTGTEWGVVWTNWDNGFYQPYFGRFDSDGNAIGSTLDFDANDRLALPRIDLNWNGSQYAILWVTRFGTSRLMLTTINAAGTVIDDVELQFSTGIQRGGHLDWTGEEYVAVWDDGTEQEFARLDTAGNFVAGPVTFRNVADTTFVEEATWTGEALDVSYTVIAPNPDTTYFVTLDENGNPTTPVSVDEELVDRQWAGRGFVGLASRETPHAIQRTDLAGNALGAPTDTAPPLLFDLAWTGSGYGVVAQRGGSTHFEFFTLRCECADDDTDRVCNVIDNCQSVANLDQTDDDGDTLGNVCDFCFGDNASGDADTDGTCGDVDNCPSFNPGQENDDGDVSGNACELCLGEDATGDADGDGICDDLDNCPADVNPAQADTDIDLVGDACDPCIGINAAGDADADGVCLDADNCPTIPNPTQEDTDNDFVGDACDECLNGTVIDTDADGICDAGDNCPSTANPGQEDGDRDGLGDTCDACFGDNLFGDPDADGICDGVDNCQATPNPHQADSDVDGVGDACDVCTSEPDTDEDGACDPADNCPLVANAGQGDVDGDGFGDACDVAALRPAQFFESDRGNADLGRYAAFLDVDNDGFDDLLVTSEDLDLNSDVFRTVTLYPGGPGGISDVPTWSVDGPINPPDGGDFGRTAPAGDINNDGFEDFLVGATLLDAPSNQEGRAELYIGSATGPSLAWSFDGDQPVGLLGIVDGAGDVNGDGFDDVVVAAPLYNGGDTEEGRAYLFFGSSTGPSLTPDWIREINENNAQFGSSVRGVGDVNNDGFDDVLIAAPNTNSTGGRVYLYQGASFGLPSIPSWTAELNQTFARLGTSIDAAGDVNGDGFDDVIVAAPGFNDNLNDDGIVFVYHGSPTGLPATADWSYTGDAANALFGSEVAGIGDIDGDGFDDVAVLADGIQTGPTSTGRAYVFMGSPTGLTSAARYVAELRQDGENFPIDLIPAGDTNGDGLDDFAALDWNWTNGEFREGGVFVYRLPSTSCEASLFDEDEDGVSDLCDLCAGDDATGDPDGDLLCTDLDNCPSVANPDQLDADLDGNGDACDTCSFAPDTDLDGVGDACDECVGFDTTGDTDADRVCSDRDNCLTVANPTQFDTDVDGLGNACDLCPLDADPSQTDSDGDGAGDACDCTPADGATRNSAVVASVTADEQAGATLVSWNATAGADTYSIYRATRAELTGGSLGDCIASAIAGTSFLETDTPTAGETFFYIVQGVSAVCGDGPTGFDGEGNDRGPAPVCP